MGQLFSELDSLSKSAVYRAGLRPVIFSLALLSVFAVAGCGDGVDQRIQDLRARLVATSVPEGEVPVPEARKAVQAANPPGPVSIVVRGRINAGELPPWETGKAAFMLTDATGHDGDETHDPHTCPFCSRNIEDMMARVEFLDDKGQVIAVDSRNLFDVKEHQLVVVKGKGVINDSGILILTADSLYVKR
jgi:hypothetical protein